ncbi:DICT sensory domain-containing protein [Halobacterium yunchengense]|uniref:DICT sensory domain-containing protein n=1 Tax=Halobacterium yunchengense TaxID=3108497 RepID=UPI00300AB397
MRLRDVVSAVRDRELTLTVYTDPEAAVVAALREYFASRNVAVQAAGDADHPEHAVLSDDGEFLAAVGVDGLRSLTDGGTREVGERAPYGPLLAHLDRTTFTSYSRRQMLAASREIEDRAWRAGAGRLDAGFQRASNFATERETYARLAATDLDVHVYGVRDEPVDVPDGVAFHGTDAPDVAATWFVVFDGGGDERQASALVAVEREDADGFYGFWTYDPGLVDEVSAAVGAPECEA